MGIYGNNYGNNWAISTIPFVIEERERESLTLNPSTNRVTIKSTSGTITSEGIKSETTL